MTDEKILEVITLYEQILPGRILEKHLRDEETDAAALEHLLEMLPQMREFVRDDRREKLMRWLGWVQGVLYMTGVYTLEQMKEHNKPDPPKCTGYCIFDGFLLGPEDLTCPVHGILAQEAAKDAGWRRLSWMKAARLAFPYAPEGPPVDYYPGIDVSSVSEDP